MINWLNVLITAAAASDCSKDEDPSKCGSSWAWNCGLQRPGQGNCAIAKSCNKSCWTNAKNSNSKITCEEVIEGMKNACGGPGPGPAPTTGCTRSYDSPADYVGNKSEFLSGRDGVIEQDADNNITVKEALTTPQWCKDPTVKPPEKGWSGDWKEYYRLVGLHKLACVGWTFENHHNATCKIVRCEVYGGSEAMKEVYSYDHFAQAVGYFPEFANLETMHQSRADIAAFMAHVAQETGGDPSDPLRNAMCWVNEIGMPLYGTCAYGCVGADTTVCGVYKKENPSTTVSDEDAPAEYKPDLKKKYPYWNSGYFGHGAFQLSYCYNHLFFSNWVEATLKLNRKTHPEFDFYWNPGFVATGNWAFASALWFYMSASSDGMKPSMHSIVKFWDGTRSKDLVKDNNGRVADFGYQVNIINGGLECSNGPNQRAKNRLNGFKQYFAQMGGDLSDLGAATNLSGCDTGLNSKFMLYWDIEGKKCSGDSINQCADDKNCPAWVQSANYVPNPDPKPAPKPAPKPTVPHKCCVQPSALKNHNKCDGASEGDCNKADSCEWVEQTECVDNVFSE